MCSWDLDQEHFIYKSGDYYIGYFGVKLGRGHRKTLELILPATHRVGKNRDSWPSGLRRPQELLTKEVEVRVKLPPRGRLRP